MMWRSLLFLLAGVTGSALAAPLVESLPATPATAHTLPRVTDLAASAPDADPKVLGRALQAMQCAAESGMPSSQRLAVIDYSLPSSKPRLWVFDLASGQLLFRELVAHGRNTGDNDARFFSNEMNSRSSSIGLFRTLDTYEGGNGYSLRLEGLERGFNDRAYDRAIVMHGAPYVSEAVARAHPYDPKAYLNVHAEGWEKRLGARRTD